MSQKNMLRSIIVDDEPPARKYVRNLLASYEQVDIIGECRNGSDALDLIEKEQPDLVFLDVQMPGVTGLEVVQRIRSAKRPIVVFVTAYDTYALKAFDLHAADYLLKPFDDERFAETMDKVMRLVRSEQVSQSWENLTAMLDTYRSLMSDATDRDKGEQVPHLRRLPVRKGNVIELVDVEKIDRIDAADYYVEIHAGRERYLIKESMNWMEAHLDASRFVRIHRSSIVALDRIVRVHDVGDGAYEVELRDGVRLPVSRRRRSDLERALGKSF